MAKYTDEQIKKALKRCKMFDTDTDWCDCSKECLYNNEGCRQICADALDLINRQEAGGNVGMKVLVACEESQRVCMAFREKGHEAYSCDIQECSGGHPEWHIQGDVLPLLNGRCEFATVDGTKHKIDGKWDLIIAHPPCTYMSKAGARWMFPKAGEVSQERLALATKAKEFFFEILNADCDRICVENPRPLKIVGLPIFTQVIQPYQFGHPYSKATCLWLKNLKPLQPTDILEKYKPFLPSNTGAFSRGGGGGRGVAHNAKDASKTFEGIAKGMADQWGQEVHNG